MLGWKRSRRVLFAVASGALLLAAVGTVAAGVLRTEALIDRRTEQVLQAAKASVAPRLPDADARTVLPAPVQRWIAFTFPDDRALPRRLVHYEMQGRFRRPGAESFEPMTAAQAIAAGRTAFVFDATTWIIPGLWARAMDAYVDGEMDMKARVLSTITAVDEVGGRKLNRESVRRYLLESVMAPAALLPSARVRWEPIDLTSAWAVIRDQGIEARYRVEFDGRGAITRMVAPADGSLDQPYHGAGEVAERSAYRKVDSVMLPMRFTIARKIDGEVQPFWKGRVTRVAFDALDDR